MKKSLIFTAYALAASLLFTSCGSVPSDDSNSNETIITTPSVESINIESEETVIEVSDDSNNEKAQNKENLAFISSLENVNLSIPSKPNYVTVKNDFVRPFTILATDNNNAPIANFPITVKYPSSKIDGVINYSTENLFTDANGNLVYTASAPQFSALDSFVAYPTPINEDEEVMNAVMAKATSTPWRVKSDIVNKSNLLFVWDFKESGNPYKESSPLLSALKGEKIPIGNAPNSGDPSYFNGSTERAYLDAIEYIEKYQYGYLIYGTIKFTTPVTETEDGDYMCELKADIQAITIKDGSIPFHKTFTQVGKGINWNYCVDDAKTSISQQITDALLYELN